MWPFKKKPAPSVPQKVLFPKEHINNLLEHWDRKTNLNLEGKSYAVAERNFWLFAHKHCPELEGKLWDLANVCGVGFRFTEKLD